MSKKFIILMVLSYAASAMALPFASRYALVVEEGSGKVLLFKNADVEVPIASLTKLMTAMVVLDAIPTAHKERELALAAPTPKKNERMRTVRPMFEPTSPDPIAAFLQPQ